jgi:hypothetical protein
MILDSKKFKSDKGKDIEVFEEMDEYGNINFLCETHWSSNGLCKIIYDKYSNYHKLSYGAGGWNKGFSHREIAEAMSIAFGMASKRLQSIDSGSNPLLTFNQKK